MKSPAIEKANYIEAADKSNYSDLLVLRSGGGWYVGTLYNGDGYSEPGSRDSDYFATKEEAEAHLKAIEAGAPTRMNP